MPECHKCPLNGTGSPECLECKGPPETNHHGRVHVSLQSSEAVNIAASKKSFEKAECIELKLDSCCQDAVRRLLAVFAELSADDISMVCHLLKDRSLAEWGRNHGMTKQAASYRHKRLVKRHPEIRVLLYGS